MIYCCNTSYYSFSLKRHALLHGGVRPFSCTTCNKGFYQRVGEVCSLLKPFGSWRHIMLFTGGLADPYEVAHKRPTAMSCLQQALPHQIPSQSGSSQSNSSHWKQPNFQHLKAKKACREKIPGWLIPILPISTLGPASYWPEVMFVRFKNVYLFRDCN